MYPSDLIRTSEPWRRRIGCQWDCLYDPFEQATSGDFVLGSGDRLPTFRDPYLMHQVSPCTAGGGRKLPAMKTHPNPAGPASPFQLQAAGSLSRLERLYGAARTELIEPPGLGAPSEDIDRTKRLVDGSMVKLTLPTDERRQFRPEFDP
jgi:hypothetical protein